MRRRKARAPRREFAHLEAQLPEDWLGKAWRNLIDHALHGKEFEHKPTTKYSKISERIDRGHARRERYNTRQRAKKAKALLATLKPGHVAAAAFLECADPYSQELRVDLLRGALLCDARLTKKLIRELDVIDAMLNPPPAWGVDIDEERRQAEADPYIFPGRSEFELTLAPIPVPEPAPNTVVFHPGDNETTHAPETETTAATRAAS